LVFCIASSLVIQSQSLMLAHQTPIKTRYFIDLAGFFMVVFCMSANDAERFCLFVSGFVCCPECNRGI